MIKNENELINDLKCEEICALETTGSLKNKRKVREVKFEQRCDC
ncbi:MAG: hypothetical protein V2A62_00295 [Candidatus Woesearchaeota archaeon]